MVGHLPARQFKVYMHLLKLQKEKNENKFTFLEALETLKSEGVSEASLRTMFKEMRNRDWLITQMGHPSKKDFKQKYFSLRTFDEIYNMFHSTSSEPS